MKNQKGMGQIGLVLCIIFIIALIIMGSYFIRTKMEEESFENKQTDMLVIQGKVKVISQEALIQKQEELLKGRKIIEALEDTEIKKLLEQNIISKEEELFDAYYLWDQETLKEVGLENMVLKEGYYLVNYDSDEIIYTPGIKKGNITYYKLSEIKEKEQENSSDENEIMEIVQ